MKIRVLLSIVAAALSIQEAATADFETATNAVANMKLGWNLGNTLEAGDCSWITNELDYETAWQGTTTTQKIIDYVKELGFRSVRIPCSWFVHMDANYNISPAWMDRVQEVVDYVINEGMYCILNVHHDCGAGDTQWLKADMDSFDKNNARFVKIWQQIATRFADYGHRLVFEGYNEMLDKNNKWTTPADDSSYEAVNKFAQSFINTVRATGGNNGTRNLIVSTYSAAHVQANLDHFKMPTDNVNGHLIAEIHSYDRNFLLSDIVTVLQQSNTSLRRVDSRVDDNQLTATTKATIMVKNAEHLHTIMANLKKVRSVTEVIRTIK